MGGFFYLTQTDSKRNDHGSWKISFHFLCNITHTKCYGSTSIR
jgi:hypothetical protein